MSIDPLINDGTYLNGKHNYGVYNSKNLNCYIYCYQSPIVLIDPNGKQSYFMHGTGSSWDASTYFNSNFRNKFKHLSGNFSSIGWSGSLRDGDSKNNEGRISAGHRIASIIINDLKNNYIKNKHYTGMKLIIGGHSHGGNVARIAAKDVFNALTDMVNNGELDQMPTINLVMINTPSIVFGNSYKLTRLQSENINTIQVNANWDFVSGAGRALVGSGAVANHFYNDSKTKITYSDQYGIFESFPVGLGNHMGTWNKNVNVWFPLIKDKIK